jgi:ligand-binding sensor domain-containing protein/signal transduction histidine kinase
MLCSQEQINPSGISFQLRILPGGSLYVYDVTVTKSVSMKSALLVAILVFGVGIPVVKPQDTGFRGYTERFWEAQDGLPDQTAQAFAQTEDGSLWIGTKGGLLRFDGARFIIYNREIAPALLERGVNCLLVSRDGSLWIGTEGGGLVRYKDHKFQSYPATDGLTNEFVRAIYEDRSGTVWIGADQGLFQVTGSSITRIDNSHGTPTIFVRAIVEDREGCIWAGGTTLLEFDGKSFVRQYPLPGGPSVNLITSMYSASDGTLWVGTLSGLHRLIRPGNLKRLPGISAQVSVIRESADGTLWAGTIGQGLFYYRQSHLFHIASGNLPSRTVEAVLEDREQNIWLGTQAGIVRLSRTPVSIVHFPGGADSEFETLYCDTDGTIWVAASTHLFQIRDGVPSPYVFPGLPGLRVRTLLRDRQGSLWIGTDGAGLFHLEEHHVQQFNSAHGLINDFVRAILQSRDGTMWVGTDGGLTHLDPKGSQYFDTGNGLAYFSVTALLEDRNGDIWVGTSRGLTHISRGKITHDEATKALEQEQLWSISQDLSGEIWFGTSTGLYGFGSGTLIHLTTAQGLANNTIYQIMDDSRGNVWLGGPNSVSRLRISDLDEFAQGARSRVNLTHYEDSHDLQSAALYSGMQPEGAVAPNGDVWFPTNKGAVRIAMDQIVPAKSSPVMIDQVAAEGQLLPLDQKIILRPGNARLEISYAAIDLRSQEGLRYRYEMEGLESWNEAFTRRTAYYTHLPPGRYRFHVQAFEIGNPGVASEAVIEIIQEPHVYTTSWFLASCGGALLSLVFLAYSLRLRQMKMRFHAVSEERARLAREMHDTVIQGCVGVSSLLEAALGVDAAEEPLRQQLLSYATDQVRATIEAAREAVWALRDTSVSATDAGVLCADLARRFQSDSGISIVCRVEGVPFLLGEYATRELTMTIREALTNAVLHASPKFIEIDVCFTEDDLKIEVCDDGCGFDVRAALSSHGHYGILGMQERVQLMGGDLKIESDRAQSTRVRISIPRRRVMERILASNASEGLYKN